MQISSFLPILLKKSSPQVYRATKEKGLNTPRRVKATRDQHVPCSTQCTFVINALRIYTDSRRANHGILPHDGKNITFRDLNTAVRQTFNFAPSFCFFVPKFSADFLDRSYWTDKFDLEELSKHNAIEHDASLTRRDAAQVPDQGKPDLKLVEELLTAATGKGPDGKRILTKDDLSKQLAKRRAEARAENPEYSESMFHNMFGSAK